VPPQLDDPNLNKISTMLKLNFPIAVGTCEHIKSEKLNGTPPLPNVAKGLKQKVQDLLSQ
jgi:hypothetical protein